MVGEGVEGRAEKAKRGDEEMKINEVKEHNIWADFGAACELHGIAPVDILNRSRKRRVAFRRAVIAHILRCRGYTLQEIGRILRRHHTSVMAMLKRVGDAATN